MKLLNTFFLLLLFVSMCEARDINLDTMTVNRSSGIAVYTYDISEARHDRQPEWTPGKQPVPLTIDQAIQIARDWINKQTWHDQFENFDKITLDNQQGCWYYEIDYNKSDDNLTPTFVMVLLDGSIVEPKIESHKDSS
jgi:hypothetical protein